MISRPFGKTGWQVSEVGYGCWGLGGDWGPRDDAQAQEALRRGLDLGVTFFDTAYVYGGGRSEELLGQVLGQAQTPFQVATKIPAKNLSWPADPKTPAEEAFPANWIIQCTETSLKRLGLERIDLQQLHVWTDAWVEAEGWQQGIEQLKRQGKIKAFGISTNDHDPDSVLKLVASGLVDSVQVIYNIFDQSAQKRLFPLCQEHGVAVIVRVPFDEGGLTGTFTPQTQFGRGDWRGGYFKSERLQETCQRVEKLKPFLTEDIPTIPHLALKFALNHSAVSTVIPGMRRLKHVDSNVAVSDGKKLPEETAQALQSHAWPRNFYVGSWDDYEPL